MPAEVTAQAVLVDKHVNDCRWKQPGFELKQRWRALNRERSIAKRQLADWKNRKPGDETGRREKAAQVERWEGILIAREAEMKECERETLAVKW